MRLAGLIKGGYYPTPERVVELVADRIGERRGRSVPKDYRNPGRIRILDPCCGHGNAILQFANQISQRVPQIVQTYGVELEPKGHRTLTTRPAISWEPTYLRPR